MLEMEPCRSLGEEWCKKQLNIATSREKLNKPYHVKKLKDDRGESNVGVQKTFVVLGFEELRFGT